MAKRFVSTLLKTEITDEVEAIAVVEVAVEEEAEEVTAIETVVSEETTETSKSY